MRPIRTNYRNKRGEDIKHHTFPLLRRAVLTAGGGARDGIALGVRDLMGITKLRMFVMISKRLG